MSRHIQRMKRTWPRRCVQGDLLRRKGRAEEALKVFRDADVLVRWIISREGNTPVCEARQVSVMEIVLTYKTLERHEEALPNSQIVVEKRGRWRTRRREKASPRLEFKYAIALSNHSRTLSSVSSIENWMPFHKEAAENMRKLARAKPRVYDLHLSSTLLNYSLRCMDDSNRT
jgi:hypothetical protein